MFQIVARTRVLIVAGVALATAATLSSAVAAEESLDVSPGVVLPATSVTGSTATMPDPQVLSRQLRPILTNRAAGSITGIVSDPATGEVLFDRRGQRAQVPASTLKVLTSASILQALSPEQRISTKVLRRGNRLILVGGGDGLLASSGPGSLTELADAVATAFGNQGRVKLSYDDSLFDGPRLAPGVPASFVKLGIVAPVSALMVDGGRVNPSSETRSSDPARSAATSFARLLDERGLNIRLIGRGLAKSSDKQLAAVESSTIADQVEHMLTESDNTLAEVLGHLAGATRFGRGSFDSSGKAIEQTLTDLGIERESLVVADASGLSRDNRVPASVIGTVLGKAALLQPANLWPINSGLPVAGATGTLEQRFPAGGAGYIRAKTGTLTGVTALAGTVRSEDGRVLTFSFMANGVPNTTVARQTLDQAASVIAACGCR